LAYRYQTPHAPLYRLEVGIDLQGTTDLSPPVVPCLDSLLSLSMLSDHAIESR
jgi:hypothetical protein